ncbi:hypothetical protein LUZ61_000587 [Rhynchospora tenuis]|uniref:Cytochrome P450 n=1 Tax=Rhynchospora tenuis TaxID=198213 RepID=A0AAD6EPZ6_9POAL|nr:hypothetical protein LUZ61_000587 [Rhynchospora tenuis]
MLLHFGQVPTLVVSSADVAQEIMKKQDAIFASRPSLKANNIVAYGAKKVTFAPYGEYWKHVKKIYVAHLLGHAKVRSFEQARMGEVELVLEKVRHAQKMSNSIDLTEVFNLFTVGTLGRVLSKSFSKRRSALELIEQVAALYYEFNFEDYFPALRYLDRFFGVESKFMNIFKRWDAFFEDMITDHIKRARNNEEDGGFIEALLLLQANNQLDTELTREHLKAFLTDMLGAGVHTTFTTLDWAMAELMRNQEIMKLIQEQLRKITPTGGSGMLTNEDIKELTVLTAVIKETLRLHPPGPVAVPRQSIEESRIIGYTIPKGTTVFVNIWSINRDPKYWECPDEFRPERFIGSTVDFWGNNFQFIPFGAGRRICPGIQFAMYNIEVLLANVLCKFDWELPNGMKPEELDMGYAPGLITVTRNKRLILVPK